MTHFSSEYRMTARLFLFGALAGVTTLAACSDSTTTGPRKTGDAGRVRFVNATTDTAVAKTLAVRVDDVPLTASVAYGAATAYVPTYVGARHFVGRRADVAVANPAFDATVTVAQPADYTVLATGSGSDLSLLVLADVNTAPPTDMAEVRVVDAAAVAGSVDVYVTTTTADLATSTPVATALPFRGATSYVNVPAGAATRIRVTATGTTTVLLDVTTAKLLAGQIRTIVALEKAGGGLPLTSATLVDRNP